MLSPENMDIRSSRDLVLKDSALDAALFDMAAINNQIEGEEDELDLALAQRQITYSLLQATSRSTAAPRKLLGQSTCGDEGGDNTMTEV